MTSCLLFLNTRKEFSRAAAVFRACGECWEDKDGGDIDHECESEQVAVGQTRHHDNSDERVRNFSSASSTKMLMWLLAVETHAPQRAWAPARASQALKDRQRERKNTKKKSSVTQQWFHVRRKANRLQLPAALNTSKYVLISESDKHLYLKQIFIDTSMTKKLNIWC